jgi:hypothetical protein
MAIRRGVRRVQAERGGRPKPATMFGLKGLGQARKAKVALDRAAQRPEPRRLAQR